MEAIVVAIVALCFANLSCLKMSLSSPRQAARFVYGEDDALFGSIEKQQGDKPFGVVLDAGTGIHSLRWLATLKHSGKGMERCVAVTADRKMQRNCQLEVEALNVDDHIDVVIGNWFDETNASTPSLDFYENEFDVIIADYLIGAMDGFSPYAQDMMIPKLARLLRPGGRLYIVGLQPVPDEVANDEGANLICKVRQVRDACILLAGHRCYREYPMEWIQRQVQGCGKLKLVKSVKMPILYRHETVVKQINVARSKFPLFPSKELTSSMAAVLDDLEAQTKAVAAKGRIRLGFDYIVGAEKLNV